MYISSYTPSSKERIRYQLGSQDGHGGHSEAHHAEMREIAEQTIKDIVPPMAAKIYNDAIKKLIGALEYDVQAIVEISLKDAHELLTAKTRKIVSDRIVKEIQAKLGDLEIHI